MAERRTAFFVSDRTGITAEMLGHSLLTQFDDIGFDQVTVPFIDTVAKAQALAERIDSAAARDGLRPIVISTLVNEELSAILHRTNALMLNCFETFIRPLEAELGLKSSHHVGRSHSMIDPVSYSKRIEAVNFTMTHDDGSSTREFRDADVILVGVSRSGKTPTCLYLALQYGVRAANYPFIPEDFPAMQLPDSLAGFRSRLYGLTIAAERLHQIRTERRPGSKYASLANCEHEVREAEALMRQTGIPYLDTTSKSIEEIASTILHETKLSRHLY